MREQHTDRSHPAAEAGVQQGTALRRLAIGFVAGLVVWLLLTGSLSADELVAGLVISALVALLALPQLRLTDGLLLGPALPYHLGRFAIEFLIALLVANLDMARRVLSPRLPIDPDIVEVPTALRSDLGRLLLANSITLTPGTLTVDIEGDHLRVHWIDVGDSADLTARSREISDRFERHLRRFLR